MKQIEVHVDPGNTYCLGNQELFSELKDIIECHYSRGAYVKAIRRNAKLSTWIDEVLPMMGSSVFNVPTKCYWIMHGIHEFPRCLNCGKVMDDRNVIGFKDGYAKYCCNRCQITSEQFREQRVQTWREHYGDEHMTSPAQAREVYEKREKTCIASYGVPHPMQNASVLERMQSTKQERHGSRTYVNPIKAKQTKLEKYGDEDYCNDEKARQTCLDKYGFDNYAKTPMWHAQCAETSMQKYGTMSPNSAEAVKKNRIAGVQRIYGEQYTNVSQVPQVQAKTRAKQPQTSRKIAETKRKNGTFSTSRAEEQAWHMLRLLYPQIERQHRSGKYPFSCDFYDPRSDTYIECNFTWTHGGHWFDSRCEADRAKLQAWEDKHTKYYDNAIETWTVRDVKKRECAEKNGLNYIVFWNASEVRAYVLDELCKAA